MRTLLTVATLLAGLTAAALADTRHDSPAELQLRAAERQERADADRVRAEAEQTTIAERDLDAARLRVETTSDAWRRAVQYNHPGEAGAWAQQHQASEVALREAEGRYEEHRAGRDLARADFARDAHLVRLCEQRVTKLSASR